MKFIFSLVLLFGSNIFAQESVSRAKATELSVHRIERLVILKKIPETFLNHISKIVLTKESNGEIAFKSFVFLENKNVASANLEINMDDQGKTISHQVVSENVSPDAYFWPQKDSATLIEDALHFVLEGWVEHSEVKIYFDQFESIELTKFESSSDLVAHFIVTATNTQKKLHIYLKPDGTFLSHELK